MSRKSLILCVVLLGGMLLAVGVAVFWLYSGTDVVWSVEKAEGPAAFNAVPADAALVAYGTFADLAPFDVEEFHGLKKCGISVSLHYSGNLHALYALDLARAEETDVVRIARRLVDAGMVMEQVGDLMVFSSSSNLVKSSLRHLETEVSVCDSEGFLDAYKSVRGNTVLLIPSVYMSRLMSTAFTGKLTRYSSFLERVADWYAFEVGDALPLDLDGTFSYGGDDDEFLSTLDDCIPGVSSVAESLPSYTLFAVTLPIRNLLTFAESYQTFADSRQNLNSMKTKQKTLGDRNGITPMELFARLQIEELATAGLVIGSRIERVNLMKVASRDMELILKDSGVRTLRGYKPAVYEWNYASYLSSVYGNLFQLKDESCCTYINGWIIVGSHTAVDEFVSRGALGYTLKEYASHAGRKDLLSDRPALAVAYFSMSEDRDRLDDYFKEEFAEGLKNYIPVSDYNPAILSLGKEGEKITITASVHCLQLSRVKAPSFDRDTTVAVPEGPFSVRMSKSGEMFTFYQNKQKSICLSDVNDNDLWGIPFKNKICGTAYSLDYFDNGKYQIIFGAGSSIYIVDRLGRYVYGYPLDLGKEITLGPDLYDFSGTAKYNIVVLHKDNTIEMYDLKGEKPSSWKTISLKNETIKSLPKRLVVGGRGYWVVRTSIQTLIYPFNGGSPLTDFKGDSMIRPDSKVVIGEDGLVEFVCYDGKTRTLEMK